MIELKRLKLINWHNFENVTFDCARLTYMIGVNAVGRTTILDAIRYCLTTNRNFNALGNKKSGRTLQGSVHAKQRGENAYRRPGRTVAYIGAEFWDSVDRTNFVIAVRVESEGPMQELHPGDQTWYISENGCTLEQLPFIDPRTGAPSSKENFKPAVGRLSYTRSPGEARGHLPGAGHRPRHNPLGKVQQSLPDGYQSGRESASGSFCISTSCLSPSLIWKLCRATGWSWKISTPC